LANLEYGRPPIVYATNYADADDLDQAKVNAVYNQPWTEALSLPPYVRWAITVASGAAWKPIDGTGKLTGMRGALQPYGSSVNWPLLGEWKDIEQKIGGFNMKHRVVQTRPGQNYYSLPGRGTVYVDGLSIIWRLLTP